MNRLPATPNHPRLASIRNGGGNGRSQATVAIVIADLAGFSSWAVRAGDTKSLNLMRAVDARVATEFQAYGGVLVKRLGDGTVGVFEHPSDAVAACGDAIEGTRRLGERGYRPRMRAAVHSGVEGPSADDGWGVDIAVAYRLGELAPDGKVVVSGAALEQGLEREHFRPLNGRARMSSRRFTLDVYEYTNGDRPTGRP
jgi:adenylate cyclase